MVIDGGCERVMLWNCRLVTCMRHMVAIGCAIAICVLYVPCSKQLLVAHFRNNILMYPCVACFLQIAYRLHVCDLVISFDSICQLWDYGSGPIRAYYCRHWTELVKCTYLILTKISSRIIIHFSNCYFNHPIVNSHSEAYQSKHIERIL